MSKTANWNTDYGSIGPRVGFAYQLDEMTVLRGGYGAFYDPQANEGTTIRQERHGHSIDLYALAGDAVSLEHRFPGISDSRTDSSFGVFSWFGTLKGIDQNFKNASGQQFNLSMQSSTDSALLLYHRLCSLDHPPLSWANPIDQPAPAGEIHPRREFYAEYPNVTAITLYESVAVGSYNSLQTSFQQRLSRLGSFLTANYVWAHALDNAPFDGGVDGPFTQNPYDRNADYANSDNDIRNRVNVYGSYELPFGPGRALLNSNSFLG